MSHNSSTTLDRVVLQRLRETASQVLPLELDETERASMQLRVAVDSLDKACEASVRAQARVDELEEGKRLNTRRVAETEMDPAVRAAEAAQRHYREAYDRYREVFAHYSQAAAGRVAKASAPLSSVFA